MIWRISITSPYVVTDERGNPLITARSPQMARQLVNMAAMIGKCPLNRPCVEHQYYHGAEAEELREGIEKIINENQEKHVLRVIGKLSQLLDAVDARDSLAYLEAMKKEST